MKKIKIYFTSVLLLTTILFLFSGCGSKLPDSFKESDVEEQSKQDIELAQSNQYDSWKSRFVEELQPNLTHEIYDSYLQTLNEKGAFKGFGKCAVTGQEKDGNQYAIVLIIAEYENGNLQYTISYDTQMHMIDFLIK